MPTYEVHDHDVLVIGAGGAGLRAAIEASAAGCRVGLVCKSLLGKAHTVMAEGGVAAAMANVDERDNWRVHFADTMRGGQYLNNPRMAELHAKEAPARVRELEAWGALFDRTQDGKILQRNFGGHRYPRLAHVGDRTGLEMIRTLQDHGIHQGLSIYMEMTVTDLIKDGDRIAGAFGYDRERGRFRLWRAPAIVLATGGIGRAFKITSNSWEYTGDGHALAYRAGADLLDMEFVQFHPTGMVWPPSVRGILVTEGVRGEGGRLLNNKGERFMFNDIPDNYKNQTAKDTEEGWRYVTGDKSANRPPELLTRDHVARCINREVKTGRGSPHGGVFLDIAWIKEKVPNATEHIEKKLPSMYHQFITLANVDITKEPMEVGPTTHYSMGGVRVDGDTQMSTVPGLFAAGEVAAGLHGANRLGGNSLSDLLVFGKRAGEHAAAFAKQKGAAKIDESQITAAEKHALEPFDRGAAGENPYTIQHELQDSMQELVGIVRLENEMARALEKIQTLRARAAKVGVPGNREYNPGWHTCIDLRNLLICAEAVTRAAIERKESRGAQFRDDYPAKSDEWGQWNLLSRCNADGSMKLVREPVKPIPAELQQVIEENKQVADLSHNWRVLHVASIERIQEARALFLSGHWAMAMYCSGLAVECLLQAMAMREGASHDESHHLFGWLKKCPSSLYDALHKSNDWAILTAVWRNHLRYLSDDGLLGYLRHKELNRGIKGDSEAILEGQREPRAARFRGGSRERTGDMAKASLINRVNAVLAKQLKGYASGLDRGSSPNRVIGYIVSSDFRRLDPTKRQKKLWSILERHFETKDLANIGPIVPMTPAEADIGDTAA